MAFEGYKNSKLQNCCILTKAYQIKQACLENKLVLNNLNFNKLSNLAFSRLERTNSAGIAKITT
jgi:hypothetical protein